MEETVEKICKLYAVRDPQRVMAVIHFAMDRHRVSFSTVARKVIAIAHKTEWSKVKGRMCDLMKLG